MKQSREEVTDSERAAAPQRIREPAVQMSEQQQKRGLLTAEQVAERLGVSKQHVYGMMDRGQIPYVRIPGKADNCTRRIDPVDLDRWIAEHKTSTHRLP